MPQLRPDAMKNAALVDVKGNLDQMTNARDAVEVGSLSGWHFPQLLLIPHG